MAATSKIVARAARRPLVLALSILVASACGSDSGSDPDGGGGGDPLVDGGLTADADPGADAGVGPRFDVADGVFLVRETLQTRSEAPTESSRIDGRVLAGEWGDPTGATIFHTVTMEIGDCRLLEYEPHFCDGCAGVCTPDDVCVEWPTYRSVGDVTVTVDETDFPLSDTSGWYYGGATPDDLFASGHSIELAATGADEIDSFEMTAVGVDRPVLELSGASEDTIFLTDGDDFEVAWGSGEVGARARLQLKAPNGSHGSPLPAIIECEGPDAGSFVIPREIVEAFPEQPPTPKICAGHDCPPSVLQRYTSSSVMRGGKEIELRAASEILFAVAHQ